MKDYKLQTGKYRELLKPKFYPKGTKVSNTIDDDGTIHLFLNDFSVPKNRFKDRTKTKKKATHEVNLHYGDNYRRDGLTNHERVSRRRKERNDGKNNI